MPPISISHFISRGEFIRKHCSTSAKLFLFLCICVLPACASKKSQSNSSIYSQDALAKETRFASQVGNASKNTPFFLEWTPFDVSSTVIVGQPYISALGETCRQAMLENNGCQKRIAVCQNAETENLSSSTPSWRLESVINISTNSVNQECQ